MKDIDYLKMHFRKQDWTVYDNTQKYRKFVSSNNLVVEVMFRPHIGYRRDENDQLQSVYAKGNVYVIKAFVEGRAIIGRSEESLDAAVKQFRLIMSKQICRMQDRMM